MRSDQTISDALEAFKKQIEEAKKSVVEDHKESQHSQLEVLSQSKNEEVIKLSKMKTLKNIVRKKTGVGSPNGQGKQSLQLKRKKTKVGRKSIIKGSITPV